MPATKRRGHTHAPRECTLEREPKPVAVRVLGGDYDRPVWLGLTVG